MQFIIDHWAVIATALWGICEVLALIPSIKANSVFTLIYDAIKKVVPKKDEPQPPAPGA